MAKELPEEWTNGTLHTLYVVADLGLKKSGIPADLRIKRKRGKTTSVLMPNTSLQRKTTQDPSQEGPETARGGE